jgi:hypothetical protein
MNEYGTNVLQNAHVSAPEEAPLFALGYCVQSAHELHLRRIGILSFISDHWFLYYLFRWLLGNMGNLLKVS